MPRSCVDDADVPDKTPDGRVAEWFKAPVLKF
jgi:hypothetical protein